MFEYKELYTIDFREVEYYLETYFAIKEALDFPINCGCNWDAIWDFLTDMVGRPVNIEILGLDVIKEKFDETADEFIDLLREFKHYSNDKYAHEIQITIVDGESRTKIE